MKQMRQSAGYEGAGADPCLRSRITTAGVEHSVGGRRSDYPSRHLYRQIEEE